MNFPIYFSRKIALSKDNKNNLSRTIVFIGRLSVALGILVSLITISTGLGSKYAIKNRLADFGGEISVKSSRSNASYTSSILDLKGLNINKLLEIKGIDGMQKYATISGIFRTEDDFAGIVYKGVGKDFDHDRFQKFLVEGSTPKITEEGYNSDIVLSQKISSQLKKKLGDSIVAVFSKEDQKPIYRKFRVVGIYKTDIKMIDDLYVIGDINHARKILGVDKEALGGYELFLKRSANSDEIVPQIEKSIGYKNYIERATDLYPQIVDWINIFDTNIALIITIMLIVVVINIIMVLLILIIERTNSIGMLKTLGATNRQIRAIFINYTLLIMVPGLIIGNVIGVGLLLIQKYFGIIKLNPENYYVSEVPVDLNPIYILGISLGVLVISAVSLVLPSYFISKISPVKAIKYD